MDAGATVPDRAGLPPLLARGTPPLVTPTGVIAVGNAGRVVVVVVVAAAAASAAGTGRGASAGDDALLDAGRARE